MRIGPAEMVRGARECTEAGCDEEPEFFLRVAPGNLGSPLYCRAHLEARLAEELRDARESVLALESKLAGAEYRVERMEKLVKEIREMEMLDA
jgi:hypothetical protein